MSELLVDAVLLAGGRGRRAGGPKALKVFDGELLWRWQAGRLLAAGVRRVAAVLHPAALTPPATPIADCIVLSSAPAAEMFISLQQGLRALAKSGQRHAVMVLPVDCPLPGRQVTDALLTAAASRDDWLVVAPQLVSGPNGGRRGHPLILARSLCATIVAAGPDSRLDHMLAKLPAAARIDVPVDDDAILANRNRWG